MYHLNVSFRSRYDSVLFSLVERFALFLNQYWARMRACEQQSFWEFLQGGTQEIHHPRIYYIMEGPEHDVQRLTSSADLSRVSNREVPAVPFFGGVRHFTNTIFKLAG